MTKDRNTIHGNTIHGDTLQGDTLQGAAFHAPTLRDDLDDAACWRAVQSRDRAADGLFWYGVRSTGVYCRPHCPSRPARRENVTFHATRAEAVAAGYRPCKRCRPERDGMDDDRPALVARACG